MPQIGWNMAQNSIVFSGYVQCNHCQIAKMRVQVLSGCSQCRRRDFEYGVMHKNAFVSYKTIKDQVKRGHTFIDGTHAGRLITHKTFGLVKVG